MCVGKLLRDICPYVFPGIPCLLPMRQLDCLSLVLQGRTTQQNTDNRGAVFLAFESQIPGSRHKPKIWKIRWKAGKLSPDQIRLFRFGEEQSQKSQESWYDGGVRGWGNPWEALSTSHLPCSPGTPRRGKTGSRPDWRWKSVSPLSSLGFG